MKKWAAVVLGLVLAAAVPAASLAQGRADRETDMARTMQAILAKGKDPAYVAKALEKQGARFVGYRQNQVTFVNTGDAVVATDSVTTAVGPDLQPTVTRSAQEGEVRPLAGEKADLTLTMWLYEWRNRDGTYSEQAMINGEWSDTEYSWLDDPLDVIDVRWIVGDLVYVSSTPYDGVQRDQHTQGIASFTVGDQVENWDLFVNFRPSSSSVVGKWTNLFVNYTHTWFGVRLGITLGAGPNGSTGSITLNTDAKTWTEGTGLAILIGAQQDRGPVTTGQPVLAK
jgi:hypothetical protein